MNSQQENIQGQGQPQGINIPMKDTKPVICECGSDMFQGGFNLREVSSLFTGTGKNEIVPVQIAYCLKCLKKFEPPTVSILAP
jgi:hypothetical protein